MYNVTLFFKPPRRIPRSIIGKMAFVNKAIIFFERVGRKLFEGVDHILKSQFSCFLWRRYNPGKQLTQLFSIQKITIKYCIIITDMFGQVFGPNSRFARPV